VRVTHSRTRCGSDAPGFEEALGVFRSGLGDAVVEGVAAAYVLVQLHLKPASRTRLQKRFELIDVQVVSSG